MVINCIILFILNCLSFVSSGYGVARVKLGDCYYYGYGTEPNMELAVEQYRMASDKMAISQAMFNLGYMYEQGIGLQQVKHDCFLPLSDVYHDSKL